MIVIGVTGGLGTGKSTVARMFGALGAVVIDADRIAHAVMEPKRIAWRRAVELFGEAVLSEDQTINRKKLGEQVFQDPEARQRLEAIPSFARGMVAKAVEAYARSTGRSVITPEVMAEVRQKWGARFRPLG